MGPDYPLGTIGTVLMAYEAILVYQVVNVAEDFKRRPFLSSRLFLKKVVYKSKGAYGLRTLNPALEQWSYGYLSA